MENDKLDDTQKPTEGGVTTEEDAALDQESGKEAHEILEDIDYTGVIAPGDVHAYLQIILQRYATLTIYVIEPYVALNEGEPLVIPAGNNYSIRDYGGRLVVSADDLFAVPLFTSGPFLAAVEAALEMILDAGAKEIAILGDQRAKLFVWDRCERLKTFQNYVLSLINFNPPETFGITREAVLRYLQQHGIPPKLRAAKAA